MEQPLVSIIIPVYKVEKYLRRCLDSVRNQTYKNFEVILVDDGSPDTCPVICDEYSANDNRFHVIHKENGGVSNARNAGLDYIKKDQSGYILFVDSDDEICEDLIEKCVEKLLSTGADAVVFGTNIKAIQEDGSIANERDGIPSPKIYECPDSKSILYGPFRYLFGTPAEDANIVLFKERTKYNQFLGCWNWCYRKSSILNHDLRFHNDLKLREDGIFNSEFLMHATKTTCIPEVEYIYYKRHDGASRILSHRAVDLINKIQLVKYRSEIRDYILEHNHIDISEWTYGSYVLSLFQLCAAFANQEQGYKELKKYIQLEEVKKAIKAVPLKGNIKLVLPLALCKCHCYHFVYVIISTLQKMGVNVGL